MIAAHLILKKNEGAKSLVPHLRVFCLSARCAASIRPVRAVSVSPIDSRTSLCLGKSEARDRDRRLSRERRALLSLTSA